MAVSGGRDSVALLHATVHAASACGLRVAALHVHHGLQAAADAWTEQVQRLCRRWAARGLPLVCRVHRLEGAPPPGHSVEAWARAGRYDALARMAREEGATLVLLAHHRDDQAETVLLQALRGGGPAGLAAMPRLRHEQGLVWARPWLDLPRSAIEHYVRRHRLRYVDDQSNADRRHARNRLRLEVLPALRDAFPDADVALAEVAAQAAQARALIDEVVAGELPALTRGGSLQVAAWAAASAALRPHLLRAWLQAALGRGVPHSLIDRLLVELPGARSARWPAPGGALRCHRGELAFAADAATSAAPPAEPALPVAARLTPGTHECPGGHGRLHVERVAGSGVALERLGRAEWRGRRGGESFCPAPGAPARSLKKQFQAAGLAAWQRAAPLLWSDGMLVFVPGLGIDARALAAPGEPRAALRWQAHDGRDGPPEPPA